MEVTLKIKFATIGTEEFTKEQIEEAICGQYQSGGETWFEIDGIEYAAIAQDAEPTGAKIEDTVAAAKRWWNEYESPDRHDIEHFTRLVAEHNAEGIIEMITAQQEPTPTE